MTKNLIKLNTARNCLRYIIRAYGIEEIYVPYYICPTIKSAIRKEKAKINFYHVDKNIQQRRNKNSLLSLKGFLYDRRCEIELYP